MAKKNRTLWYIKEGQPRFLEFTGNVKAFVTAFKKDWPNHSVTCVR